MSLRVVVGVTLLCCAIVTVGAFNNGRPYCRKPEDFTRGWAVKNDPSKYWTCTGFATSELLNCAPGLSFSDIYLMCTVPGAILGEIERPGLVECGADEEIDLSVSGEPFCAACPCSDGLVVYDPEGHPVCHRDSLSHIVLCPGAPESKRVAGTQTCTKPACSAAEFSSQTFYPSANPNEFYRCGNVNKVVTFQCSGGLCFDATTNNCVWPHQWTNPCA